MVLQAAMICIDNSEWMRNEDFKPNRIQAQIEAISFLCSAILCNSENNTVGLLTMAGKHARVEISLTNDFMKLIYILNAIQIEGEANLRASIKVAQMVLKHRKIKNCPQRIIDFTGSPWSHESRNELVMIGRNLSKDNVALDVVHFDDEIHDGKFIKIHALIHAAGCDGNYNIAYVRRCLSLPEELMSGRYDLFTRYYSKNPELKARLTFALQAYIVAQRANEQDEAAAAAEEDGDRGNIGTSQQCSSEANNQTADDDEGDDEEQKALAMSMEEFTKSP